MWSDLFAYDWCLVVVVQIEGPQKTNRLARHDVGHKPSLYTDRYGCTASQDGKSTDRLHHLNLEVPSLGIHLDFFRNK